MQARAPVGGIRWTELLPLLRPRSLWLFVPSVALLTSVFFVPDLVSRRAGTDGKVSPLEALGFALFALLAAAAGASIARSLRRARSLAAGETWRSRREVREAREWEVDDGGAWAGLLLGFVLAYTGVVSSVLDADLFWNR